MSRHVYLIRSTASPSNHVSHVFQRPTPYLTTLPTTSQNSQDAIPHNQDAPGAQATSCTNDCIDAPPRKPGTPGSPRVPRPPKAGAPLSTPLPADSL
nr:hypothetical protein Itr_chr04CG25500 [Ipomoea trifida]